MAAGAPGRPLWALARRIRTATLPSALRVHVLTDRPVSERLREIPPGSTAEKVPVTFQIWDVTRLKRIHDASSVRDDLVVDFSGLPNGGLPVLPASLGSGDYDAYLAVVPGEVLADIYVRHGSRLLEGNVRTFLGRGGKVNKGILSTIAKEPGKFFAYNNGIAATASEVTTRRAPDGSLVITSATDLQIVNGAQTMASLATALRDKTLAPAALFVPMKLSVVSPAGGADLIPRISRFANSQNGVKPSDFFANHPFHRRIEELSRRILSPSKAGSQLQTHWYYERARGQYLNDQAGLSSAKRSQFQLVFPRTQVIRKTDLAKVECCFNLEPDIACKGAEKAFVSFAERIAREWEDEQKRTEYGDDWFKAAVARAILFRAAEAIVSKASWYESGYRAQIVAYACARLAGLAQDATDGGTLDYARIWSAQAPGPGARTPDRKHCRSHGVRAARSSAGRPEHRRMGQAAGLPQESSRNKGPDRQRLRGLRHLSRRTPRQQAPAPREWRHRRGAQCGHARAEARRAVLGNTKRLLPVEAHPVAGRREGAGSGPPDARHDTDGQAGREAPPAPATRGGRRLAGVNSFAHAPQEPISRRDGLDAG
jgi:hypothetical protein